MFGDRLKKLREDQGMTQYELAELLNVSRQSIGGYENDNVDPGIDTLVNIANIFNISLDYLLCRTDEPYNTSLFDEYTKEFLIKIQELKNYYKITKR